MVMPRPCLPKHRPFLMAGPAPRPELGVAEAQVLQEQVQMCQELLELEPQSRGEGEPQKQPQ